MKTFVISILGLSQKDSSKGLIPNGDTVGFQTVVQKAKNSIPVVARKE